MNRFGPLWCGDIDAADLRGVQFRFRRSAEKMRGADAIPARALR